MTQEFEEARKHDYRTFTVVLVHSKIVVRECPYCWGWITAERFIDHAWKCLYFPQIR